MKRCHFMVVAAYVLLASVAWIQPAAAGENAGTPRANSLQPGSWSMQLSILDNFRVGSFYGTGLSMKHHTSRKNAFRFGARVLADYDSRNEDGQTLSLNDTTVLSTDTKYNSQTVEVNFVFMHYVDPDASVNVYLAWGPVAAFGHSKRESTETANTDTYERVRTTEDRWHSWSVGALGAVGAECFVTHAISIHAEYWMRVSYTKRNDKLTISSVYRQTGAGDLITSDAHDWDSSGWSLYNGAVTMGMSLYF